jgi:hypothetical protein
MREETAFSLAQAIWEAAPADRRTRSSWRPRPATATPRSRPGARCAGRWLAIAVGPSPPRDVRRRRAPDVAPKTGAPLRRDVRPWRAELLFDHALDGRRLELALVRLHDVADDAPDCFASDTPSRATVSRTIARVSSSDARLGQELRAETDLEVDLRDRVGSTLAGPPRILRAIAQLLLVGRDHVQPEAVVEGPLETGGGAPLMCFVLIMRMQSAVRASLARMASLRRSWMSVSTDMGVEP